MQEIPTQLKRQVRQWAGIAHDRDLRKALAELRAEFDRWERGEELPSALLQLQHIAGLIEVSQHDLSASCWR
jgi:hypothetical protein